MKTNEEYLPDEKRMRQDLYALSRDALRYRKLRDRYTGADFSQPSPTGQGTRCVLIFDWPERDPVSKSLDDTVDSLGG